MYEGQEMDVQPSRAGRDETRVKEVADTTPQ